MRRLWMEVRWWIAATLLSWILALIEREASIEALTGVEILATAMLGPKTSL